MIDQKMPKDWRDLQNQVSLILQECGFDSEIEKQIQTVRGSVDVDVFAEDKSAQPNSIYLCECKYWSSAVPKTVVHAFRTVVSDFGANWGFIISSAGFQSGAFEATANSNVKLFTWWEFQDLLEDRWVERYMRPQLQELDPLIDYTELINSRIFRKADELDESLQRRFVELREKYADLAYLILHYSLPLPLEMRRYPDLPLGKSNKTEKTHKVNIPDEILNATCLREFVDSIQNHAIEGISAFDEVFGGRA